MAWIFSLAGLLFIVLISSLIFLGSTPAPKKRGLSKNKKGNSATKANGLRDHAKRERLSHAERVEMFQNVRNLAGSNPEKMAALLREWMKERDHGRMG